MRALVILAALLATPALAQQQTVQQRLGQQIGALVIENAALTAQVEQLQDALTAAHAKIRQLEATATRPDHTPEKP